MAETIPAQKLSDIIGLIYDCAIDPARWPIVLESINAAFNFAQASFGLHALPSGQVLLHWTMGVSPQWHSRLNSYGKDMLALWGGLERVWQYPLDEPILHSELQGIAPVHDNRYYIEWLEPQGLVDAVIIAFARDAAMFGSVGFSRHVSGGNIGNHEMEAFRVIAPHFRRAGAISKLLDLKTVEARTYESTLNALSVGIVLVDEHFGLVHANSAAESMLSSGDPILMRDGRLAALCNATTARLQASVHHAATQEHKLGQRGIGIPLRHRDGSLCVVHVLPMGRGEIRPGLQKRAKAALFIASAQTAPQMPRDALTLIYDLTNAESRVFELIVEGRTQGEIARVLGVAASTVKTHLLHVFDKSGCNRQADLVRLAASLSMPL